MKILSDILDKYFICKKMLNQNYFLSLMFVIKEIIK